MLKLSKGAEILETVGAIASLTEAKKIIEANLDQTNLDKLSPIANSDALIKIANSIVVCKPDAVFINSGSPADVDWIRQHSLAKGEEKKLTKDGHTIHFDLPQDQARLVNQTFYIINDGERLSSLAKSLRRDDAIDYVHNYMDGIMKGMTMMIGFYSRGPAGAEAAVPAIEISSSAYVMHSAELLYRNCYDKFDLEADRVGIFFTNLHSEGKNRPEDVPNARILMDRSWFTTFSTYCTYAGNTLLMKKGNHRFSVDYATYYKKEAWLSEHMFITGLTNANGRTTYMAGAAPSGCGKTTTAMVGTDFIGDDLAQIWIAGDGTVRAINPEKGIFGIVEDVNREGDPHLMECLRGDSTEVIWSNVLIDDHGVPHWVGNGEKAPEKGINFQGEWWAGKTDEDGKPVPMSHKNSRCTLLARAIANHNTEASEDPSGVPVKVITYSGRDSDTMPPVWAAKTMDEGVAIGASIVSQATATEVGVTGVRRQPWANAPFIPGDLADYMEAQFIFFNSEKISEAGRPVMAGLNYFLTHKNRGGSDSGLLGEKRDVKVWLGWLDLFANGEVQAVDSPIGWLPRYEDLKELFDTIGKAYPKSLYDMQFALYVDNIVKRIDMQTKAYQEEVNIPAQLFSIYEKQKAELLALREKRGPIVSIDDLG